MKKVMEEIGIPNFQPDSTEYMENFDDFPVGDLLDSEGEGDSVKVKPKFVCGEMDWPKEDVDLVCKEEMTKEGKKGKVKKIVLKRKIKLRTDDMRENSKSKPRVNEEWSTHQKKDEPIKKRKKMTRYTEDEENEEVEQDVVERTKNHTQICQMDCQVNFHIRCHHRSIIYLNCICTPLK